MPTHVFDGMSDDQNLSIRLQAEDRVVSVNTVLPILPKPYKAKYVDQISGIENNYRKIVSTRETMKHDKHLDGEMRNKLLGEMINVVKSANNKIHANGGVLGRPRTTEHESFEQHSDEARRSSELLNDYSYSLSEENKSNIRQLSDRHAGLTELLSQTLVDNENDSNIHSARNPRSLSDTDGETAPSPKTKEIEDRVRDVEGYLNIFERTTEERDYARTNSAPFVAKQIMQNHHDARADIINRIDTRSRKSYGRE
jgi:hypothetical protein